jgi:2',3'-cyclic-nucleotide 2'-phosphodiesterase
MPGSKPFVILALGDVFGRPGRDAIKQRLQALIEETGAGFVMVNGENAAGGLGITPEVARDLLDSPINVLTSGNHIWKHKEIVSFFQQEPRLLRPANYPINTPGKGAGVFWGRGDVPVGVLNLEGQLFMSPLPCPFRTADAELSALKQQTPIVIVDFHAEATSEKRALGHYLDGRVSAVVGTHTHIPTADATVLKGGTGYLTDLGMCGPTDSVIGIRSHDAINRFLSKLPSPFSVANSGVCLQGAVIEIDANSGKCLRIDQRSWPVDLHSRG